MTVIEFSDGLARGEQTFTTLMACVKNGDFTLEEFNSFQQSLQMKPLFEMVDAFYNGELFRAQACDFVSWCDGVDLYHDRDKAAKFEALVAGTRHQIPEIQNYIAFMVRPRRVSTKVLKEDMASWTKILEAWNKRIDINGWRSWPKQRGK